MFHFKEMDLSTLTVMITLIATIFYTLYGAIYRLYFSPVAKFPGPKVAALTFWYEFYYDVLHHGSYAWEIERMHKKYGTLSDISQLSPDMLIHRSKGPIIRINPYELHIVADPEFLKVLYPTINKNVEKWSWSAGMLGSNAMTFGTVSHDLHRQRRGAISPFFSKASIRRLQPVIQILADKLCNRIEEKLERGQVVNLVHAYSAFTQDVITEYCFSDCRNVLDKEDFGPEYGEMVQKPAEMSHL